MAKADKNVAIKGLRGMVGDTLVFRRYNGKTIVAAAPSSSSKEPSEQQRLQRERFRLATFYASRVRGTPSLLTAYEEAMVRHGKPNLQALIVSDYFRVPKVLLVEIPDDEDSELPGDQINVVIDNLVRVKKVTLTIRTPDNTELESGSASIQPDQQTWVYPIQDTNTPRKGIQVEVTVSDLPGNTNNCTWEL